MNKLIILLIIINFSFAISQDREPSPMQFVWGLSSTPRVFAPDSFKQNSFLTGFQWSGTERMNQTLQNNSMANHGFTQTSVPGYYIYPINMINQPTYNDNQFYAPGTWNAPFINYEPTLPLDSGNIGTVMRTADTSNPVFGFLYRRGTILTDSTNNTLNIYHSHKKHKAVLMTL